MIYVTSDIHGKFNSLKIMLDHVGFNSEDRLIINGDIMDRGEDLKSLIDFIISKKSNIDFILGNHEIMFLDAVANGLFTNEDICEISTVNFFTGEKVKVLESYDHSTNIWFSNGGDVTFKTTSIKDLKRLFNYLKDKPTYKFIDNNLFVHAGPHTLYSKDWSLDKFKDWVYNQLEEDLVWDRNFFDKQFLSKEEIDYPVNIFIGHNSLYGNNILPYKVMNNGNVLVNTDQSNNRNKNQNNLGMYCIETKTYYKLVENDIEEIRI